jgi:hypothetical protein
VLGPGLLQLCLLMDRDEKKRKEQQRRRPSQTQSSEKARPSPHAMAIFKPRNLAVSAPLVVAEKKTVEVERVPGPLEEPSSFEGLNWSQVRASRLQVNQSPIVEAQEVKAGGPQSHVANEKILRWALPSKSSPALEVSRVWFSFQRELDAKSQSAELRRPKRIIRTGSGNGIAANQAAADAELMEQARKAFQRFARRQCASKHTAAYEDIFADAGVFDPSAAIPEDPSPLPAKKPLNKAVQKLFKKPAETAKTADPSDEPSVFDLIAGKALEPEAIGKIGSIDEPEATAGGLFGFSAMLPKLGRLAEESRKRAHTAADDDAYADILNDDTANDETVRLGDAEPIDAYLEEDDDFTVDEIGYDTTKEEGNPDAGNEKGTARKLRRKEAKEATAIERILTAKYNMKL